MRRHEFLGHLHRLVAPRNYLEIGVSDGRSLTLAGVPSIGIDPAPKVQSPLGPDAKVVRATSDAFFARTDPLEHLRNEPRSVRDRLLGRTPIARANGSPTLDLVFIDGMHLLEFALRDFMNVERYAGWTSVIVFDDVLPRDVDEAARDRHTKFWAGDVFKIIEVLRRYRPDLVILPVDTVPTGTLVVIGGDPDNRVLQAAYDEIVRTWALPDPQAPPESVLARRDAVAPERVVEAGVWSDLIRAREDQVERAIGYAGIRAELLSLMPIGSAPVTSR